MKKILVLSYFMLTWFVCQSQTFYQVVSLNECGVEEPFFYFDQDGTFEYSDERGTEVVELDNSQIEHINEVIFLRNCEYEFEIVTDCNWISKVTLRYLGTVIQEYSFKTLSTRD